MKRLQLFLVPLMMLAAANCTHRTVSTVDPVKANILPPDARVVAQTATGKDPLLFIPNVDGTAYYLASDDLLATFAVRAGERVELNSGERSAYRTELRVDGKSVFNSNSRASRHRIYFTRKA